MTRTFKMALLVAVGAVALTGAAPAFAASAATDAFVANVHPNVDFLDNSSRLALQVSTVTKIRAFARDEATDQTLAGNQLVAWTQTETAPGLAVATGAPEIGKVVDGGLVTPAMEAPFAVADGVTTGVGDVVTGRSVAIDTSIAAPTVTRTPAPGTLLPSEETDMSRLRALSGRRFDAFYRITQTDALRQLATLYTDYLRDGDDPALRTMAVHQLPIVRHRLLQLHAM